MKPNKQTDTVVTRKEIDTIDVAAIIYNENDTIILYYFFLSTNTLR